MSSLNRLRIGYAFSPNKEQAVINQSLIDYAKLQGVDLVRIDLQIPLLLQSPFDCIIHKVYEESWIHQLRDFTSKNLDVAVVDPPESISRLLDRASMLEVVNEMKILQGNVKIQVPKQVVLEEEDLKTNDFSKLSDLRIKFPMIAKPLEVSGTAKSHELSLVYNRNGLKDLTPPVVLQEFVNHGGVLFKVYAVGDESVCVKRNSLPDILETEEELDQKMDSVMKFSQISRAQKQDLNSGGEEKQNVKMPPSELVNEIARGLGEAMGLRLFNFDLIRDQNNTYFVLDINYLPGYAAMPNYEQFLTKFLKQVAGKKKVEEAPVKTSNKARKLRFPMGTKASSAIKAGFSIFVICIAWWVFH